MEELILLLIPTGFNAFTACLACWGDHVRFVGGQSWLFRRSLLWRAL